MKPDEERKRLERRADAVQSELMRDLDELSHRKVVNVITDAPTRKRLEKRISYAVLAIFGGLAMLGLAILAIRARRRTF